MVYSSGSVVIMQDVKSREQQYIFGGDKPIEIIVTWTKNDGKERLVITSDGTHISFWDADSL